MAQPSGGVPTRPLQGFKGGRPEGGAPGAQLSKEAAAAQKEAAKYNMMAPPTAAYTADLALARASAAMEGARQQVPIEVGTRPGSTAGRLSSGLMHVSRQRAMTLETCSFYRKGHATAAAAAAASAALNGNR